MADTLVSCKNADFAEKMLVNTQVDVVRVEGMNHFVPWSNPELIHDAVLRMLDKVRQEDVVSMDSGSLTH
jgi:hypothetical protein